MFIFSLPTFAGVTLTLALFSALSVALYFLIHPLWRKGANDDTRRLVEAVTTRVGILHGIVLGMMFANTTAEHVNMTHALEKEAAALIRLHNAMERQNDARLHPGMEQLGDYIHFVVEVQWPGLRGGRVMVTRELTGRAILDEVWRVIDDVQPASSRDHLMAALEEVEEFRNFRLFDYVGTLLPLFWYTAIIGYLLTLAGLCISPPSSSRCIAVALYGSMVGVVLYGILVMTQPYSLAAGVRPHVFEWLLKSMM